MPDLRGYIADRKNALCEYLDQARYHLAEARALRQRHPHDPVAREVLVRAWANLLIAEARCEALATVR